MPTGPCAMSHSSAICRAKLLSLYGEGRGMAAGREERGVAWQQGGGEGRDMAVGRRGGGMCDKEGSLEQLTWAYYTHSFEFHKVMVWGKYRP